MQYFLLATGEHKKLQPLTHSTPAPMCPVLNRPVMLYSVELMARAGAKEILTSLLEHSASVEEYFGDGKRWHTTFRYLPQHQPLGTVGALKRFEHLVTETVLVLPADALLDLDIAAAEQAHRAHGGRLTVICHHGKGKEGEATGAFLIEPELLAFVPAGKPFALIEDLVPAMLAAGEAVHHFATNAYWNPLATFPEYHQAQQDMFASLLGQMPPSGQKPLRYPVGDGCEIAPGIWSGTHTVIHPKARLVAPLYLGADCRIGAEAEIGPETVLGTHTVVDTGATVQRSTVLPHTYIGEMVDIQERVVAHNLLIDQKSATTLAVTDRFLLSKVTPQLPRRLLRMFWERGLALLLLMLVLPLLLLLGLLNWGTSGSLPFVYQRRLGTRPIAAIRGDTEPTVLHLLRLRTRQGTHQFLPLGQWLEQWDLHRLPELWNVVSGQIALVGVKPLTVEEASKITEEWQLVRYQCAAGFTGLWYIQMQRFNSFEVICMADTYHAATNNSRQALHYLWHTPQVWRNNSWQLHTERQLAQSSEVRSQPAVH